MLNLYLHRIFGKSGETMQRVAIFVDGGGFFFIRNAVRDKFSKQLDFGKFCRKVLGGERHLLRAYFCNALPSQAKEPAAYRDSIAFMDRLERIPYVETSRSYLMYPPDGGKPVQKGVDMRLAMHMLKLAYSNAYDVAVLVCGDSDLEEVVKTVKDMGKQVEYLCCTNIMKANALVKASDMVTEIDIDWFEDCLVED